MQLEAAVEVEGKIAEATSTSPAAEVAVPGV